jgi:hypothetical protein
MQETLELLQNVSEGSGMVDYRIGPAYFFLLQQPFSISTKTGNKATTLLEHKMALVACVHVL